MHLRYNERKVEMEMEDIMGIIDEKIDLIASFMPIGTLALLNDMCENIFVFLRKLVVHSWR